MTENEKHMKKMFERVCGLDDEERKPLVKNDERKIKRHENSCMLTLALIALLACTELKV